MLCQPGYPYPPIRPTPFPLSNSFSAPIIPQISHPLVKYGFNNAASVILLATPPCFNPLTRLALTASTASGSSKHSLWNICPQKKAMKSSSARLLESPERDIQSIEMGSLQTEHMVSDASKETPRFWLVRRRFERLLRSVANILATPAERLICIS